MEKDAEKSVRAVLLVLAEFQLERTVKEVAQRLNLHPRSIYRFLKNFRSVGFSVEKTEGGIYRVRVHSPVGDQAIPDVAARNDALIEAMYNKGYSNRDIFRAVGKSLGWVTGRIDALRAKGKLQKRKVHHTQKELMGPATVLSKHEVLDIYGRFLGGEPKTSIAARYSLTPQNISLICLGKSHTAIFSEYARKEELIALRTNKPGRKKTASITPQHPNDNE